MQHFFLLPLWNNATYAQGKLYYDTKKEKVKGLAFLHERLYRGRAVAAAITRSIKLTWNGARDAL